jgi:WD40 repeat protein
MRRTITLTQHDQYDALVDAAISPDGNLVATKSYDGGVVLWDARTGTKLVTLPSGQEDSFIFPSILFSPDGRWLAWSTSVAADQSVDELYIANVASRQVVLRLPLALQGQTTFGISVSLAFNPDSTRIAAGECANFDPAAGLNDCTHSQLEIFDRSTGLRLETAVFTVYGGQPTSTSSIAFSSDGNTIALGGFNNLNFGTGNVRFWDLAGDRITGTPIIADDGSVNALAYSPDGHYLATVDGYNNVSLWDVAGHSLVGASSLHGHSSLMSSVAFSPDGQHFATCSADRSILIWSLKPFTEASQLLGPSFGGGSQVAYSPDGTRMVSGSQGTTAIWNAQTGTLLRSLPLGSHNALFSAAFSPDGKILATGDNNANIILWNAVTGAQLTTLQNGHTGSASGLFPNETLIYLLAFSPDGHYLLSGSYGGQIVLWDVASHSAVDHFPEPLTYFAYGGAFSPDGKFFAVSTATGVEVRQLSGDHVISRLRSSSPIRSLAFGPQDLLASLADDGTIRLWHVENGQEVAMPMYDVSSAESIVPPHLAFSPDGSFLISSHDESLTIWDMRTRTKYINTVQVGSYILNAIFSPNGRNIAVATATGLDVWYARLDDWKTQACAISGRNLTRQEWAELIPQIPSYQQVCPNLGVSPT